MHGMLETKVAVNLARLVATAEPKIVEKEVPSTPCTGQQRVEQRLAVRPVVEEASLVLPPPPFAMGLDVEAAPLRSLDAGVELLLPGREEWNTSHASTFAPCSCKVWLRSAHPRRVAWLPSFCLHALQTRRDRHESESAAAGGATARAAYGRGHQRVRQAHTAACAS